MVFPSLKAVSVLDYDVLKLNYVFPAKLNALKSLVLSLIFVKNGILHYFWEPTFAALDLNINIVFLSFLISFRVNLMVYSVYFCNLKEEITKILSYFAGLL